MRAPADCGAAHARSVLAKGSTSFAAAARVLPAASRDDVARLYAWCRHLDDEIDGQSFGHNDGGSPAVASGGPPSAAPKEPSAAPKEDGHSDLAARLARLTALSDAAIGGAETGHPVFDGFGEVATRHAISEALAHDHLAGFAMDVEGRTYPTLEALAAYCYGVAGSVGVMMALVLGVPPTARDTLVRASDLGLAFQLTNIARDLVADAQVGRVYAPLDWLAEADVAPSAEAVADPSNAAGVHAVAVRLAAAAEPYYASARVGMAALDYRSAWAIGAAASIYRAIGERRRAMGPQNVGVRARTSATDKLLFVARNAAAAAGRRRALGAPRAAGLWEPPLRP